MAVNFLGNHISGVSFKELKTHPDDRGFFREVIRYTDEVFRISADTTHRNSSEHASKDGFAQWSHSKMARDTVKAWHFHHRQIDWWYVPIGVIRVVLFDKREESESFGHKMEFTLGESDVDPNACSAVVRIPQGVLHGCRVLSESAHLFYITSETYNPEDEGRYPFNSSEIPHNWGPEEMLIVAANDKRKFIPPHPRIVAGD